MIVDDSAPTVLVAVHSEESESVQYECNKFNSFLLNLLVYFTSTVGCRWIL